MLKIFCWFDKHKYIEHYSGISTFYAGYRALDIDYFYCEKCGKIDQERNEQSMTNQEKEYNAYIFGVQSRFYNEVYNKK